MKTYTKRTSLFASIVIATALLISVFVMGSIFTHSASPIAETEPQNIGRTYYREELKNSPLAQKFYDIMAEMAENGSFADGTFEYDLVANNVVTQSDIAGYVSSDSPSAKIPVAFGAARDAFFMDHPEIFYVDIYKLYLSVGLQGDSYLASIGTGRGDNYYINDTVSSESEVTAAVQKFDQAVAEIVSVATAAGEDALTRMAYVNNVLATTVKYDYGAYNDSHSGLKYDGYVHTAYGALVNKKALCDGYSTAFKVVMDRLGIPCVLISGQACSGKSLTVGSDTYDATYEPHMWNAVCIDGLWYGVDVTWNATTGKPQKYYLVGADFLSASHVEDCVISSSGFELKYPALRPLGYGVNEDAAGFVYKDSGSIENQNFGYSKAESSDNYTLELGVSYEGKGIAALRDEGKYLSYRYRNADGWDNWMSWLAWLEFFLEGNGYSEEEAKAFVDGMSTGGYTVLNIGYSTAQVQFAVFDRLPSEGFYYTSDEVNDYAVAVGSVYSNDAYMRYIPAPYVKSMTPNEKGVIRKFDPVEITLEYSEPLVIAEGKENEPIGVTVTGLHTDIDKYIKVDNVVWDAATNKLSFKFTASKQYSHNFETYNFTPSNLVGKDSGKMPECASLTFERRSVVCPKVFNDGRLYMSVFGQPQFVGAEDMSLNDFKDKDGQPVAGNQRSQLMLVVNEPTQAETSEMIDKTGLGDAIAASSTYQIDLQLCGMVQQVPKGSYMQVGFGFPEGYGPESAGVTFTVYHYTRNPDGTIKEATAVPCVVTECGIIATVQSFSPFMICAVKTSETTATRNVYASVNGIGGSIDKTTIKSVNAGESVTYAITEAAGYELNKVLLNGKDITSTVSGDTLTVAYDALGKDGAIGNSDVIEISFISSRVAKHNADNGITLVEPKLVVTKADMIEAAAHENTVVSGPTEPSGSNTGLIVAIVVIMIVLAAGAAIATVLVMRKKKSATTASATANKSTGKTASKPNQPAAKRPTTTTKKDDSKTTRRK